MPLLLIAHPASGVPRGLAAPTALRRSARYSVGGLFGRAAAAFLLVALALSAAAAPASATTTASSSSLRSAETQMRGLLNQDRAKYGLVAYRADSRLNSIARKRAAVMASTNTLSHTEPDGDKVFDYLNRAGITWYAAGEIIAWNSWGTPSESAVVANASWMGSSSHKSIILSTGYNYVGVGVAQASNGRFYWAAVTIKGPDRTGARAWMKASLGATGKPVDGRVAYTVTWAGADVRLQVLTSGLASFDLDVRADGGSWWRRATATSTTSRVSYLSPGHRYDYRVRARDRKGNVGAWSASLSITP